QRDEAHVGIAIPTAALGSGGNEADTPRPIGALVSRHRRDLVARQARAAAQREDDRVLGPGVNQLAIAPFPALARRVDHTVAPRRFPLESRDAAAHPAVKAQLAVESHD